ncbi:DNA repair protein RecN [Timonella senegalensis]|uniref:DNA repair protein RecN n=1 Tax=Timonella senegalensis TaxID=1465825 RepID=UPI0002DB9FAA|nr:DNA repair protein RecN [Timonella senegalensis]
MLEEIHIENLGVISTAQVELRGGLTAITGETGAGKTMVLTGLSLLMGAKADPATVRSGADRAVVEGRISQINSTVSEMVDDAGGILDDDQALIVSRSVASAGRSRTFLGGRSVPQQVLSDVARELVTIHGQSEQMRLRTPSKQREALDEFAGVDHEHLLVSYRELWNARSAAEAKLEELSRAAADRARESELLRIGLAEVERIDPQEHEDEQLAAESQRLSNVEQLRAAAQEAHTVLNGEEFSEGEFAANVIGLLDQAHRALGASASHDPELQAIAEKIQESSFALSDAATELAQYLDLLDSDPARLEFVEQRRSDLASLTRTYGETIDDVLAWASNAGLRLLDLEDDSSNIERLADEVAALTVQLEELAGKITAGRATAATHLSEAVTAELAGLAMKGAHISVDMEQSEELGPWGRDSVTMLLTPHPGAPARPLGKGASGGELSRVMLALEVTLATASTSGARGVPTMIFDEVDAGVGGQAAIEIGKRLARLARTFQVIVVTHLPQVAAFADQHLVVAKGTSRSQDADGELVTQSGLRVVTGSERVSELARMLSGQTESASALEHAKELLHMASVRS